MPDERTNHHQHDVHTDDLNALPPAVQALSQRLEAEGAAWRATPHVAHVGERLRERAEQLTHSQQPPVDPAHAQLPYPRTA